MMDNSVSHLVSLLTDAGGKIVGRTKLQKIAFILDACGLGDNLEFEYYHYGPYSENLADAVSFAKQKGFLTERKEVTTWGGRYSVFESKLLNPSELGYEENDDRKSVLSTMINADSVNLELAATALFLKMENSDNPWQETKKRKPSKATDERIGLAQSLYDEIRASCGSAQSLPVLN